MKTTKVYRAPGYPVDPKKEDQRVFNQMLKQTINPPSPIVHESITHVMIQTFGVLAYFTK